MLKNTLRRLAPAPLKQLYRRLRGADGPPQYGGMFVLYRTLDPAVRRRCSQVYGDAFRTAFEFLVGNHVAGDFVEFGTYRGYTAMLLASLMREFRRPERLWLYDSFVGLPEIESEIDRRSYEVARQKVWFPGQMAVEEGFPARLARDLCRLLPASQFRIVAGNYAETLPEQLPQQSVALVHLDCGLYASTHRVLTSLLARALLQDGAVLLFSDYNSNRASPRMGDRKALRDAFAGQGRFDVSPFFPYGWNGQAFFVHERESPLYAEGVASPEDCR